MNSKPLMGSWFLAAAIGLAGVGCAAEGAPDEGAPEVVTEAEAPLGIRVDVSALTPLTKIALPEAKLFPQAFDEAVATRDLLKTGELLGKVGQVGSRTRWESASYGLEINAAKGQLLGLRKALPGAGPDVLDDKRLERAALERLVSWGLPRAEMNEVRTRHVMAQEDAPDGQKDAPRLFSTKTFVFRGFGGVPVIGHRAVVTHDRAGDFMKVLVDWPALAQTGHKLSTRLSVAEIKRAAEQRLAELGKPQKEAKLGWVLVPSEDGNGKTTLTLEVAASLPAIDRGEIVEEPEMELVDVQAR